MSFFISNIFRQLAIANRNGAIASICKQPDEEQKLRAAMTRKIGGYNLYTRLVFLSMHGEAIDSSDSYRNAGLWSYQNQDQTLQALSLTALTPGGWYQPLDRSRRSRK